MEAVAQDQEADLAPESPIVRGDNAAWLAHEMDYLRAGVVLEQQEGAGRFLIRVEQV
jgi:hypothetical protein